MDEPLPERFQDRQLIGRGGAADVFRAHDVALDRPVAVKVFRPGHDRIELRRFTEETKTLAALSHPGLVAVFSSGVHVDRPYLVMRLVEGETLQSRLLGGPLSLRHATELGAVLADALAYVHRNGVVHRDVKPSNILLDTAGVPCLGDFGIAITSDGTRMTRTNEIVGTPAYLAPEQVLGEAVGPAADVYSLGLTLVECLTGVTEYRSGSEVATAVARLHREPRIPDGLPSWLAALLRAMTDREPRRRPTAARCARELRAIHEADTTVLPRRPWVTRSVAAATAGVAAVIGVVLVLHAGPAASAPPPVARVADNQPVTQSPPGTTAPPSDVTPVQPAVVVAVPPAGPAKGSPHHPDKPGHQHGHGPGPHDGGPGGPPGP